MRIHVYKYPGYFPREEANDLITALTREDTPYGREILYRFVERFAWRWIGLGDYI